MSEAVHPTEPVSERELVITREFDAPARLVFEAYSRPELLMRWFGPEPYRLVLCEVDFRVGGRFRMAMRDVDGSQMTPFGGEYLEIVPHRRIVFTDAFETPGAETMVMTVTLDEQDGRTHLTLHTLFSSAAQLREHVAMGIVAGVNLGYDQLQALLAGGGGVSTVSSPDGTVIAWERRGTRGPVVLLVDGAFCYRGFGPMPALADALAPDFRVVLFDRRGRGGSTAGGPYDLERELEDLDALVDAIGEPVLVYGISSGAALALRLAARQPAVRALAVYEPPFALDGTHHPQPADWRERIVESLRAGDRDGAVRLFMKVVGVPGFAIVMMRLMWWVWPKLRAAAHTLPHDFAALGDTQRGGPLPDELREVMAGVAVPTLAMSGGKSPPWMRHAAEVVAATVAGARHEVVPASDHNVAAKAIAPLLRDFFGSAGGGQVGARAGTA